MKLTDLAPEWVDGTGRWGTGVSWRCMAHEDCRLTAMFMNPCDGGETPKTLPGERLYHRHGTGFGSLTLEERIETACWLGFIVEGEMFTWWVPLVRRVH